MTETSRSTHNCGLLRFSGENLKLRTPEEIFYSCSCCAHSLNESHLACNWMCGCASPVEGYTSDATSCYPYYYKECAIALHNAIGLRRFSRIRELIDVEEADPDQRCFVHGNAIIALVKHEYTLDEGFYETFNFLVYEKKVDVRHEENRGRNPLFIILTHYRFFDVREKFKEILMPLTFDKEPDGKYKFEDIFKVCLLETILSKGGDQKTIENYYKDENKYFPWIERIWEMDKKFHVLTAFLHEKIQKISEFEFEYMKFLEVQRKVFKALTELFYALKKRQKRIFYQIFFRLVEIGLPTLKDRHDDAKYRHNGDRFDEPNTFKSHMKRLLLDLPLTSSFFNHLNGLYFVNSHFELDSVAVDLFHEFTNFKDFRTRIPNTEQKLLDFMFPFITPAGFQKIFDYRTREHYDSYARYSVLDCFENYAERFFPFDLYKKSAKLRCSYKVQPFTLKRIARDVIRETVFRHDCDPNSFVRNISSSFKCLPKMLRWYLRFVMPSYKI